MKSKDPTVIKITTKDDEIREINYEKETKVHENILRSLKIHNVYCEKKYKILKKRKFY